VYAIPTFDLGTQQHKIPTQYQDCKDVFEEKNVDTLFEHRPYDCAIDLEERMQPLFGPIYNLSKDELFMFQKNIDEIFKKGSFDTPSFQLVF
jgi:hypothetical protein